LFVDFALPVEAHVLFEISLHTPVGPEIFSLVLAVFFKDLSSMEGAFASLRFPVTSAACPMSLPKLLIGIDSSNSLLYVFTRVTEIPFTWVAFTSFLVVLFLFIYLPTSPVKAEFILIVQFFLFFSCKSLARLARILRLILNRLSKIATEAPIKLKVSLRVPFFRALPSIRGIPHVSVIEVFLGLFFWIVSGLVNTLGTG
jgi:hypothetical protein